MTRSRSAKEILVTARVSLLFLLASTAAFGQVRKDCGGGITMKLAAGFASQGSLVLADVASTKKLPVVTSEWDGHPQALWQEGQKTSTLHALIGIDLEKPPGKYEWRISWPAADGKELSCSVPIVVRTGKFPTEHLKVEQQYVQPDPEQEKRAAEDQKKMRAIYDTVTLERLWDGKFRLPLKDVTTGGNFGRRRILNGQARSPHSGVDFPAAAGTAVFASQSGKVVLAEELYYSGNTVVIDHGYGIYTMYCHLSKIGVSVGDAIKAGDELGKVGATGRVTGPHLHWGLTIQHARVNGMQIVAKEP
jgi:murein DD-endopeptidase MepM/ murein hydrolase activator NlpD